MSVHPDFDNYVLYSVINGEEHKIILNNVFRYSDYAFYNTDLRAVDDWYNIRYIGNKCFGNCINLSLTVVFFCL